MAQLCPMFVLGFFTMLAVFVQLVIFPQNKVLLHYSAFD